MSRLKRFGCLGIATALGLLLVVLLQTGLARAAQPVAGGAARALAPNVPGLALTKTVGLDAGQCATTNTLTAPPGTRVTYCYFIRNTGTVTFTRHFLVDNRLGMILNDFPFTLVPGATAFITQSTLISQTTVNSATWSATGPGVPAPVRASALATVTVAPLSIQLAKTVGLANNCATTSSLFIAAASTVYYCYHITNTGPVTMTRHDLVDNRLGIILTDFPFTLVPGATAFLTQSAMITQSTVNVATWTARTPATVLSATTTSSARVFLVTDLLFLPVIRR